MLSQNVSQVMRKSISSIINEIEMSGITEMGFQTRSGTKGTVQPQKIARGLKISDLGIREIVTSTGSAQTWKSH